MASCGWLKGDNYSFNGMDDVSAKHTFLNSLPEPLGDETLRMMNLQRITLQQAPFSGKFLQNGLVSCIQSKSSKLYIYIYIYIYIIDYFRFHKISTNFQSII